MAQEKISTASSSKDATMKRRVLRQPFIGDTMRTLSYGCRGARRPKELFSQQKEIQSCIIVRRVFQWLCKSWTTKKMLATAGTIIQAWEFSLESLWLFRTCCNLRCCQYVSDCSSWHRFTIITDSKEWKRERFLKAWKGRIGSFYHALIILAVLD